MLNQFWKLSGDDMNARVSRRLDNGLTLFELVTVVACVMLLFAVILPILAVRRQTYRTLNCVSNLKQLNLAFLIWAADDNNEYPMGVSVANGGAKELIETGNVAGCMRVISNELSTPFLLVCPQDENVLEPTDGFGPGFCNRNISYFISADMTNEDNPQAVIAGDDNFIVDAASVKPGLATLSTNASIAWGTGRHADISPGQHFWSPAKRRVWGNIGFADGSVQEISTLGLQQAFRKAGLKPNRIAIP